MKSFLFYHATSQASVVIITIALMLFVGYLMTRITRKFKLPNVTGYILAGILMGPYCLDMVPVKVIDGMDFLSDIALAFIAFSTGEFFRFSVLKKNGWKVIVITVMEAVLASVCVFAVVYGVLHLNLAFSIVLAALASATAPASTIMTIRQTGAKGDFVDTLLQVVALDDVVGLVEYSAAISIALAALSGTGGFQVGNILKPILINVRRYFWLAVKMHDAKEKIQRQPADHIGGSAVCFLRDLFSGRCIPSSGMYVHGNHLY